MPMPLNQLLPQAQGAALIRELTLDSRKVLPGDLFLAVNAALACGLFDDFFRCVVIII